MNSVDELAREVRERGFAVAPEPLEPGLVDALRGVCESALARSRKLRTRVPLETLARPPFRGGLFAEGSTVPALVEACLRSAARVSELWIRAAPASNGRQAIHRDRSQILGAGAPIPEAPALSVDVALSECSEENGATELWPGSHLLADPDRAALLDVPRRAAALPSRRLLLPRGGIAIRDPRLWHRVMPNCSAESRILLSLTYVRVG